MPMIARHGGTPRRQKWRLPHVSATVTADDPPARPVGLRTLLMTGFRLLSLTCAGLTALSLAAPAADPDRAGARDHGFLSRTFKGADGREVRYALFVPHDYTPGKPVPTVLKRLYLTGLSMGGFGTWALAAAFPDKWAAMAPVCGGGDPAYVSKVKDIPCWCFHGDRDPVVKVEQSRRMVAALGRLGVAP